MRKTKIVCTIGPASESVSMLKKLIDAGMDVARLNFSHGVYEEHKKNIDNIRKLSAAANKPVAIMADLCGPKIRIGELKTESIKLKKGAKYILTAENVLGDETKASVSYKHLADDVAVGKKVLIDDGLIELEVVSKTKKDLICKVLNDGLLYPHKGVNFPGTTLNISALTDKDKKDAEFAVKNNVDYIAQSFVKTADDVLELKDLILKLGAKTQVIPKIEKHEACKNIEDIVKVSDAVMVARGDLGVEIPIEEVPVMQKEIIHLCNHYSKPVITATQMLDSMIRNPRPTRAEVTDIANAILDGTDAVMLSGETASGLYPVEAVEVMASVARINEKSMHCRDVLVKKVHSENVTEAVSLATCEIAEKLGASAILTFTSSGRTARRISKYKPKPRILAATETESSKRRLNLSWAVYPFVMPQEKNTDKMIEDAIKTAKKLNLLKDGDLIVITAGIPAGISGSTNMIKIHVVGHTFLRGTGFGEASSVTGKICKAETFDEARRKLDYGDILLLNKINAKYKAVLKKVKGVIVADGHLSDENMKMLGEFKISGISAVPHAMEVFADNKVVAIDVHRGLVYEAK